MPGSGVFSQSIEQLGEADPPTVASSTSPVELNVVPRAGLAIIHFPTTRLEHGCIPDPRTMHESEDAIEPKAILQQFIWPCPIEASSDLDSGIRPCEQEEKQNPVDEPLPGRRDGVADERGGSARDAAKSQWHPDVYLEWRAILSHAGL
eukprot:2169653-Rhodomonas_salina.1